ncbi:ROK family protein [Actinomadura kijaniata]|uniref:ROK family protein n=1 Tax=Actinomadura kijaniata TaxID=46161 RepID=UPI00082B9946|nr:ROK family protein [Actinomadura kijaniata]
MGGHVTAVGTDDAKTMGRAELRFGAGRGSQHAVIGLIGPGIISNGVAHRGSASSVGERSHVIVESAPAAPPASTRSLATRSSTIRPVVQGDHAVFAGRQRRT